MSGPEERLRTALSGRYRMEGELGAGGMATVYLAEDLKHHRKVALKVLRPELAAVVGAERFLAEIETTANLQHPHILPLFDSGDADGFLYYVMPYVEGESLRDRLDREKQLPIEDAVAITEAVANALDYAHRHEVIHRDIKPANVLLQDGQPVVADFGIALALSHAGGSRLTETGLSVGTPDYMSPEQVTGERDLDGRSDIFALGCVFYEMLAGEPPFKAPSGQGVVARILADDPTSISGQRPSVPPNVAAVVWTSLQKIPADRFRSGAEMAKALADPGFRRGEAPGPDALERPGHWKRLAVVGWSVAVVLAVGWGMMATGPQEPRPVVRYAPALPAEASLVQGSGNSVALSPDGSLVAYVGARENGRGLWLKERDVVRPRFLGGSEGAYQATFSPTGDRIAFTSLLAGARALKVLPLDGGTPVTLATDGFRLAGISWGTDGHIYLAAAPDSGLVRIRESGGAVERVSVASGALPILPHALPNGRGVLMSVRGGLGPSEVSSSSVAVLDLVSGEHRILAPGLVARYSGSGHILVTRADSTVVAYPFDEDELNVRGEPVQVLQGVHLQQLFGLAGSVSMDVSANGTLVYVSGGELPPPRGQVVWVDRSGNPEPVDPAWSVVPHSAGGLGLSPDGSRLVISLSHPSEGLATGTAGLTLDVDVWLKELDTGPQTRLTFRGPDDRAPANVRPRWSPRGDFITYVNETAGLLRTEADGSGERRLVDFDQPIWDAEVAPDGKSVVFRTGWRRGTRDLWIADLASGTAPRPLLAEPFDEQEPDISPDGRWLAYVTNETGRTEVFVRPLHGETDRRWTVSENGGRSPRWSGSGDELFFIDGDRVLWSVAVHSQEDFALGDRTELFSVPADYHMPADGHHYDVSADGQRFIMIRRTDRADPGELIVVEGFFEELERLVPD